MTQSRGASFLVPWPPSTNSLWRAIKGRNILSKRYREWMDDAGAAIIKQDVDTFIGPVEVDIQFRAPTKAVWDLDNRCKAILDLMTMLQIIEEDNCRVLKKLTLSIGPEDMCGAMVTVRAA
jgi:Holliday junction resolvase RusA-like endonuclease